MTLDSFLLALKPSHVLVLANGAAHHPVSVSIIIITIIIKSSLFISYFRDRIWSKFPYCRASISIFSQLVHVTILSCMRIRIFIYTKYLIGQLYENRYSMAIIITTPQQSLPLCTCPSPPPTTCLGSLRSPCPPWERGVASSVILTLLAAVRGTLEIGTVLTGLLLWRMERCMLAEVR